MQPQDGTKKEQWMLISSVLWVIRLLQYSFTLSDIHKKEASSVVGWCM